MFRRSLTRRQLIWLVSILLVTFTLLTSLISLGLNIAYGVATTPDWWISWLQNFSTELFGAFATFLLIELMLGGAKEREAAEQEAQKAQIRQQQETEQLKQTLIKRFGSRVNSEALLAAEELRIQGWLHDGSLKGRDFYMANLHRAGLRGANLETCQLFNVDFTDADLVSSNLQQANLSFAMLRKAQLQKANLQRAVLLSADLRETDLSDVDFAGADLSEAQLEGAKLKRSHFDATTMLPDGTRWTSATDITRFTNSDHPDFWRYDAL